MTMTRKQKAEIKKGLPRDWRLQVQAIYAKKRQNLPLQRFTDLSNGKIKNIEAVNEFLEVLKKVKDKHKTQQQKLAKLLSS